MIFDTDVLEWELGELLKVSEDMTLDEMYSNSDKPGEHPEPSEMYTDLRYRIRVISTLTNNSIMYHNIHKDEPCASKDLH